MKLLPRTTQPASDLREDLSPHSPKKKSRWLIYGGAAIATFTAIVWAFRPTPIVVETQAVTRGELQVSVAAEGKTRIRDRFVISAPVSGRLTRIQLKAGDAVQPGEIVAQIEPLTLTAPVQEALGRLAEARAQREGVATQRPKSATLAQAQTRIQAAIATQRQAEASVAQAQAAFNQAQRDRQRAQEMAASGVISRRDRENAELVEITRAKELESATLAAKAASAEVDVARAALTVLQAEQRDPDYLLKVYDARIASIEADLAKLQDEANRTSVRSPSGGQVLRLLQQSAQSVTAGTPLLEIGDISKLEIVIDVLSTDALRIKPGNVILVQAGSGMPMLKAKVRQVEPSAFTKISALGVEEQRVNVIGDFINAPASLGDGYRSDVQIVVWQNPNVLKVPLSALFRCDQAWCVFSVQDSKAQERSIEIGQRSTFEAEVQKGLQAGETVILHPNEQITTGTPVKSR
ncbi:RND family efflux transporter MFP subunit [Leptolyngbya boryana NIES-2135]|jgi:HlyD family secretion protein|uniref:RND family efflux transporter MFP subunit n=1 Tax=Leptolyngbya boryana NIES-2135 TaxID=1973484 RepID=A0A1Z4JIZ2_LEPBY|nr:MULTISPECIES: efflux RND transporter periplasmic adaptor subunit [Leptolyngbya]BAY56710.1 RND family efflux transporter MFP subunit [Leptolyngbya boryana NIES-2135]MBD2369453.1 efflux RND transporter periplasmic adaptor subunit [Leptolyngbya sp. FACHB-161]MBD2376802.1 efflux RND transporter periplasmic adaptor subunit [Leptolyngbya sp. FACHB-238]MBD2401169.1 efflux RND transporter periplasmic adaptor subunit [Leptolyngbya sp. FACHB-239]MBD2407720.1 efflux RND transporter periplasmic adaptor